MKTNKSDLIVGNILSKRYEEVWIKTENQVETVLKGEFKHIEKKIVEHVLNAFNLAK